jgi:uncharacterized protein YecE (DUF72 family)
MQHFTEHSAKTNVKNGILKNQKAFKFFSKIPQLISHLKRLYSSKTLTDEFCNSLAGLEEKLWMFFLQMNENFNPQNFERLQKIHS